MGDSMKKTISKSGIIYVQKSVRNGTKVSSKTVKKLGKIDELMTEMNMSRDEVLAWADAEIHKLEQEEQSSSLKQVTVSIPVKDSEIGTRPLKQAGYLFLQKVCYELRLDRICQSIADDRQIRFDFPAIVLCMVYNRILNPSSKRKCRLDSRFLLDPPVIAYQDIYRALDILAENMSDITLSLYKSSNKVVHRNTKILYYDCTNFFMEIEEARGELSQYGVSKENRPNPIVQMGLFLDEDGIPFDMNINPGNQNETLSVNKDTVKRINRDFEVDQFIYCADAGLGSNAIRKAVQGFFKKNDFIITHSIKKMPEHLQNWALDESDSAWWHFWRANPDTGKRERCRIQFKNIDQSSENGTRYFRSRWAKSADGRDEHYIVTYCPKYRAYQRAKRNVQVERAYKKAKQEGTKKKKRQTDPSRFIKETHITKDGESAETVVKEIDTDKIEKEERYDGYYCVATTLEWEESEILKVSSQRWEIEDCFRVMKTYFDARPVYLQKDDRIRAHFLICYIALMVFRILQKKLGKRFTCEEILDSLRTFRYYDLYDQGYSYAYEPSEVTRSLAALISPDLNKTYLTKAQMKKILKESKTKRY